MQSNSRSVRRNLLGLVALTISFFNLSIPGAQAQDPEKPHTLVVLVRSSAIPRLRSAFDSIRARKPGRETSAQTLHWDDGIAIATALDLRAISASSIKPYIAQHSAGLEDLRERMCPELFHPELVAQGAAPTRDLEGLRQAETRMARWFVLTFANNVSPEVARRMVAKSSQIELAEPLYERHTCYTPNDIMFSQQYGPQLIKAPEAWNIVRCDSTMVVADVDIGTDWSHEDLRNSIYLNQGEIGLDSNGLDKRSNGVDDDGNGFVDDWHGWDFGGATGASPDNDSRSELGHGTHTAGIMAATGDNQIGIAGIAFGSRVIPIKAGDDEGSLDFAFPGVVYASDMGARVVNCSWGGSSRAQAEQDIINYVYAKGLAVIAASGNNHLYQEFYPASYDHVLSVAAIDYTGQYDGYANSSTRVAVCAPGTSVLSTVPGDQYVLNTGTSMACPHAAGSVAMVLKRFPTFTVGQAMQQVRVTCDTLGNDPNPGFTGRGRINLLRAVSETLTHSVRIDSATIIDENGDGVLTAGENANIVVYVTNYLGALENLRAKIEFVEGASGVTSTTTGLTFGPLGMLKSGKSPASQFPITVQPVDPNTSVLVRVTFSDPEVGYADDIDYFRFVVNPSYRNLNKNNLDVTFDEHGAIGYGDEQSNTLGDGFYWKNSPPSISSQGKNIVYAAGLMVGMDTDRLVSNAPGPVLGINDNDFTARQPIFEPVPPDHKLAVQELVSQYSDSNAEAFNQVGVDVSEQSYAFTQDLSANAVIVNYVIKKRPTSSGDFPSDNVGIALYADWDIGISGANNLASFDTAGNTAVMQRLDQDYPFVGVSLLSPLPNGASLNYYAFMNDGSDGAVDSYDGLTRFEKLVALNVYKPFAGPGDISIVYGIKNAPLFSEDSITMTLAIALATDAATLRKTVSDARDAWFGPSEVSAAPTTAQSLFTFPNPFGSTVHVRWESGPTNIAAQATLTDVLGRSVRVMSIRGHAVDLNTADLPVGIYHLTIEQGSTILRKEIVHVR